MSFLTAKDVLRVVEPIVYGRRKLSILFLTAVTAFFAYQMVQIKPDPGFLKMLPEDHAYIKTFSHYLEEFGGGNQVIIAVMHEDGDIYNADYLATLRGVHEDLFFLSGIARNRVQSLFSANTKYLETNEKGFAIGRVVPADYQPTTEMIETIREHVHAANIIGRLVATNERGALITAEVLEIDPVTGKEPKFLDIANGLETIREKYESDTVSIHIIGLTLVFNEFAKAFLQVFGFFAITLIFSALLLWVYCASFKLAMLPLICSIVAVIWEFGLLVSFGYGLDPFAILVPFLVLSVGVSHGVQFVNAWVQDVADHGMNSYEASLETFRRLAIPGTAALITDVIGFATIALIQIEIIQEMAINAAFGVSAIIITNKWLMPILLSWVNIKDIEALKQRYAKREKLGDIIWRQIAKATRRGPAIVAICTAVLLLGWSLWKGQDLAIGDQHRGVPELKQDSRYNQDSAVIADNFAVGEDVLIVFIETHADGCLDFSVMYSIDRFMEQVRNTPGVHSAITLQSIAKLINEFWHEGDTRWRALSRNYHVMAQSVAPLDQIGVGGKLMNFDCSIMPVIMFTEDHKAHTINVLMAQIEDSAAALRVEDPSAKLLQEINRSIQRWIDARDRVNSDVAGQAAAVTAYAGPNAVVLPRNKQRRAIDSILARLDGFEQIDPETSRWPEDETAKQAIINSLNELVAPARELIDLDADQPNATEQELVDAIEATLKRFKPEMGHNLDFALASGNVGIMAATNEVIAAQEKPILIWVYLAIIFMCWLSFRSISGVLCVVLPLSLVSLMAYGVMAVLGIGLKVATLPVVALAVGIGVDYGIYIYSTLHDKIGTGLRLEEAYFQTLRLTGKAVVFTGIALGIGVATWFFSVLQFQIDMGMILMFIFIANMFGAIFLLPALAHFMMKVPAENK